MFRLDWKPILISALALIATVAVGSTLVLGADTPDPDQAPGRTMAQQATKERQLWITTDHAKIEKLQQPFSTGAEITAACLSCHSEAANQFHETIHWSWLASAPDAPRRYGKAGDSLNNFCISTNNGADKGCYACHPGWEAKSGAINCLVCHGQQEINWSESFEDFQAFAESEDPEELEIAAELQANIQKAVQSVARPTRKNCGSCHFKGGGGDGVKHGDLDSSMAMPNKALDVHMGTDGQDFTCTRCHTTVLHNVAGRIYTQPAALERKSLIEDDLIAKITCESCHSATPHKKGSKANDHTDKVACQTCHIPTMARVLPTKMSWDWSKAGKLKDGKKYKEKGELGRDVYMSIKGQMRWEKNVKPEYAWWYGSIKSVTVKDVIDPTQTVAVSAPRGAVGDGMSRIYPFKVHRGRQPYDKVNKTFLAPLLSGKEGFWEHLDWDRALSIGQAALNMPYSGEFDFVDTTYVFPTTHMVAPKENVVACGECHTGKEGRLADLAGFYMPGRDGAGVVDALGWVMVLGSLLGVCLHGLGRIFTNPNGKREDRR
jgi:octaheme c-type cytochrome (tetrathionate reductase family)